MNASEKFKNLPLCLIIMDGFGLSDATDGNAIAMASTPNLDNLFDSCPWTCLQASGEEVGLPEGQMGNSEVGHLGIGAGRIVYQELTRINRACSDGTLSNNPVINSAFDANIKNGTTLHFMGLLSNGGVHSSNAHLYALMDASVLAGVKKICIHCILDGRDVPPKSAIDFIQELESKIQDLKNGHENLDIKIATISGRYYAMDRDKRWDRVEKAYNTIACGVNDSDLSPKDAVQKSYIEGVTDEFFVPQSFNYDGMHDGDSLIFFNFRPDRAREITYAFTDPEFNDFDRLCKPKINYVCLTEYDPEINAPIAFAKEFPENVLADVLSRAGLRQYHIAETEKYAHVTFFLNGGREEAKEGEIRKLISSPKVATYDLQPEMSEPEVTNALVSAINNDEADVYIVNFANCDMVGHTGSIPAAIAAVEAVDEGVGKVVQAIKEKGGITFVTADHGNADKMLSDDGTPHTAHTTAEVPFILVASEGGEDLSLKNITGKLADIAPTMLYAIGADIPKEMTGDVLLETN